MITYKKEFKTYTYTYVNTHMKYVVSKPSQKKKQQPTAFKLTFPFYMNFFV